MTPRQLLRLYPRVWRMRYGDEFLAMIEGSAIDRRVIWDVVRAAAGEWVFETVIGRTVVALVITGVASLAAQYLRANVPVQPAIEVLADGAKLVSPPWPVGLGVVAAGLQLVFFVRLVASFFPLRLMRLSRPELVLWFLVLGLSSIGAQWGEMVLWAGTGIVPDSALAIWGLHALMMSTALTFHMSLSKVFSPQSALPKPPRSISPSTRPLGLTSMRERVEALCGTFLVNSEPGSGTQITATIPIPRTRREIEHAALATPTG